mgnify:CR=1 FL=1
MAHCCEHNCIEELTADHQKILAKVDELEKAVGDPVDQNKVKEFLEFTVFLPGLALSIKRFITPEIRN